MIKELLELFFEGRNSYAIAKLVNGTVSYYPVEGKPEKADIQSHLKGDVVLGSYTLMSDSKVNHICWDVDSVNLEKARNIALAISEELGDIPHGIEYSGNKGYHLWVILEEPIPAARAKNYGIRLRESVGAPATGDPHVEVFPKQELLTASSPMGNLVKLPLGLHPKTGNRSMFVDCHNGWESGPEIDPTTVLRKKVSFELLESKLTGATPLQKIALLMGGYWTSGERHNMSLALSGFLASLGWSKDDVTELIETLVEKNGGDLDNLLECVETTFRRLTDGKTVQGFSALNDRLPVTVMRTLNELAGQNIADPTVQLIDRIRLEKTPTFLKFRSAGSTMFSNLVDTGKFVKTENALYWLDLGTHQLLDMGSLDWLGKMRYRFGINSKESFGVQVIEEVRLTAFDRAENSRVYKRFHWDGSTLHINFGGAEVYKLTGETGERSISYNGNDNFLFASTSNGLNEELGTRNIFQADPLNPWEFLTMDLSFEKTESNAANNEQQRQLLQAWIMQLFFGTILNTRPIALFLGPRGSGKTTTARRILRFFEGFNEDVLGVVEDKPDSLRASLEDHLVLALDNMEKTKIRWLDSFLNRLATGTQIEIRQLYKSNAKYTIKPDCFVLLTGIELPTSEESLFSRILPLELSPLRQPRSEFLIQSRLKDNMCAIWSGMFNYLDSAIAELRTNPTVIAPNSSRLADFVMFCHRIQKSKAVNQDALIWGLDNLMARQNAAMGQSSPALQALEIWLTKCAKQRVITDVDMDPGTWRNSGELWRILHALAKTEKLEGFRWTTPASFARHFLLLADGGLGNFTHETKLQFNSNNGRDEKVFRFPLIDMAEEK